MKQEIVNDIITFYKTIGGLDEISERQLVRVEELNTMEHLEYLCDLCEKYNIEYEIGNNLIEDILEIEGVIDKKFRKILLKH